MPLFVFVSVRTHTELCLPVCVCLSVGVVYMPTSATQAPSPSGLYILAGVAWGSTKPRGSITLTGGGRSERRGGARAASWLSRGIRFPFYPPPQPLFSSSDGQPRRLIHSTTVFYLMLHVTLPNTFRGFVPRCAQALIYGFISVCIM